MVDGAPFRVITEATRNEKLRMLKMLLQICGFSCVSDRPPS